MNPDLCPVHKMTDCSPLLNGCEMLTGPVAVYIHPQGGVIRVFENGAMDSRNHLGKKKKTSATPEKLAAGHGQWTRYR